ncbi:MAG TPA: acetyl-CoA acetyltransferase, partial [Ilumatobacteraceae bacterium]|nr:acetyl-CoA acetyltransferase [Ilumatobacteraceae bacterium]
MSIDPHTPVLIGAGQLAHHATSVADGLSPVALMAEAIRRATADAGLDATPDADLFAVVGLLSYKHGDPAWLVARELGIDAGVTAITPMGGNSPQSLVNHCAARIQRGEMEIAILAGGEASRTRARAKREGVTLDWPVAPDDQVPVVIGDDLQMSHPAEAAIQLFMPVQGYPMFETAIRAAAGRSVDDQRDLAAGLWSRFSAVAATNPHAWLQVERTAEEIRNPSPSNRMIGFPYPKLMNSNNDVDMGAAVIICSVAKAEALGVPRDRWVFPHSGTDCHEHAFMSNRWSFAETPAVALGGRLALELADMTIDDVDIVDLYSCFPSAVQLGAASLGLPLDRQLTRTGGLCFAGGPWNNYVMHAIATVMNDLRTGAGRTGLVWANGGFATKHAFGVYSTEPPAHGFRHAYPQDEIDAMPRREVAEGTDA